MEKKENFKEELETQYAILIKAKEKKEKQRFLVLLIILGITLFTVLISTIFSFKAFSATKNIDKVDKETPNTYYQTLSTIFNGNQDLKLNGIGNGYELLTPKTIQITNDGNTDITFDIRLTGIQTSLLSTNNLVYTITRNGETSITKELPLSEKSIITDAKISPNETITYVIKVSFNGALETGDYSNYYSSKIVVEQKDNKTLLLE
jgi:hypothetical protein